eukprot:g1748.t1
MIGSRRRRSSGVSSGSHRSIRRFFGELGRQIVYYHIERTSLPSSWPAPPEPASSDEDVDGGGGGGESSALFFYFVDNINRELDDASRACADRRGMEALECLHRALEGFTAASQGQRDGIVSTGLTDGRCFHLEKLLYCIGGGTVVSRYINALQDLAAHESDVAFARAVAAEVHGSALGDRYRTARLAWVCSEGHVLVLEALLILGADASTPLDGRFGGRTCACVAASQNQAGVLELLREYGVDLGAPCQPLDVRKQQQQQQQQQQQNEEKENQTSTGAAAAADSEEKEQHDDHHDGLEQVAVAEVKSQHQEVNTSNGKGGKTPAYYAVRNGCVEALQALHNPKEHEELDAVRRRDAEANDHGDGVGNQQQGGGGLGRERSSREGAMSTSSSPGPTTVLGGGGGDGVAGDDEDVQRSATRARSVGGGRTPVTSPGSTEEGTTSIASGSSMGSSDAAAGAAAAAAATPTPTADCSPSAVDLRKPCETGEAAGTPALYAVLYDKTEVLEYLSSPDCGVDLMSACDSTGRHPAYFAAANASHDVLRTLQELGVDLGAPCSDSDTDTGLMTPRDVAADYSLGATVTFIDGLTSSRPTSSRSTIPS